VALDAAGVPLRELAVFGFIVRLMSGRVIVTAVGTLDGMQVWCLRSNSHGAWPSPDGMTDSGTTRAAIMVERRSAFCRSSLPDSRVTKKRRLAGVEPLAQPSDRAIVAQNEQLATLEPDDRSCCRSRSELRFGVGASLGGWRGARGIVERAVRRTKRRVLALRTKIRRRAEMLPVRRRRAEMLPVRSLQGTALGR
jgi:hypothetical protein